MKAGDEVLVPAKVYHVYDNGQTVVTLNGVDESLNIVMRGVLLPATPDSSLRERVEGLVKDVLEIFSDPKGSARLIVNLAIKEGNPDGLWPRAERKAKELAALLEQTK